MAVDYKLLPFRFRRLGNRELLVNDAGDFLVEPAGTVEDIVARRLDVGSELYRDLAANGFIREHLSPMFLDHYARRIGSRKAFLNDSTTLHIFVLTRRCNQNCTYCQASSCAEGESSVFDMKKNELFQAVRLMFQSPASDLTMEFQGGEPSLVPDLLRAAVEYAERLNVELGKRITYVLCSNCIALTDELLEFCREYGILISTSLDGPEFLHNRNRGKVDSYANVVAGIARARAILGNDRVSALMTTSEFSLNYPEAIVDSYLENGFSRIFIRALNPYGLAAEYANREAYYERFLAFYRKMLDYILRLNREGTFFAEEFTALLLRKMLSPFPPAFVDLQSPAGIVNSVIVYNYDGYVYASDESRMLAAVGDDTFRLGHVSEPREKIWAGPQVRRLARLWATEFIAGCADCAYLGYCGADPVRNYSTQGDMYGIRPTSFFCKKHMAIIDHLFSLLIHREPEVMPVFRNWISGVRS